MARAIIIFLTWLLSVLPALPFAEGLSAAEVGAVGEALADQVWQKTGREPLLQRFGNPNGHGPDHVYRTRNGVIELHETKAYERWPTFPDLRTTVEGEPAMELSQKWVQHWMADPHSSFQKLGPDAQQAIRSGNFVRRVNFIKHSTSEFCTYEVQTVGDVDIKRGAKILGPFRLSRSKIQSLVKQAQALMRYSAIAGNQKSVLSKATSCTLCKTANPVKNVQNSNMAKKAGNRVVPGLLTADGRLLVACQGGGKSGVFVFLIDGGIASYQYCSGGIDKSVLNEKLQDATLKSTGSGGAVAVAILLGASPGALLAVGVGSYILADFAVQQWRENTRDRFLSPQDLKDIGLPVNPDIPLNVEHWSAQ